MVFLPRRDVGMWLFGEGELIRRSPCFFTWEMHTWKGNNKITGSYFFLKSQFSIFNGWWKHHIRMVTSCVCILLIYVTWLYTHNILHIFWDPKQPFFFGCFNWMIQNLYIRNGGNSPNHQLIVWSSRIICVKMKAGSFWSRASTTKA